MKALLKKTHFAAILLFLFSLHGQAFCQLPLFLQGTWKVENKEVFEHWDVISEKNMKGFCYQIIEDLISVSEYLDIHIRKEEVILTATVINQNNGEGIEFKLSENGKVFSFSNPDHDFPKKIVYTQQSDDLILVEVSDGNQKGFSYLMKKVSR